MSIRDNVTYPFRLAAWKTARFLEHPDEKTDERNFWITCLLAGVVTSGTVIGIMSETPDDTVIDGQEEHITAYKNQISFLENTEKNTLDKLRRMWRGADPDKKSEIFAQLKQEYNNFTSQTFSVLAGLHTENQISEKEIGLLLEDFENRIANIEDVSLNDRSFSDIGDAAHLHECLAENTYTANEIERALSVSKCAANAEKKEFESITLSPLTTLFGGLVYFILVGIPLSACGLNKTLQKYSHSPAPKKLKRIGKH